MAKQTQEEKRENELIKVRMDKMEALREKGVNPFGQRFERTHHAKDNRSGGIILCKQSM